MTGIHEGSSITRESLSQNVLFRKIEVPESPTSVLAKKLGERVIGQEEACQAVAKAVLRSEVGLRNPKRPLASMLFIGPTGVGKTEMGKTLAQLLYGEDWESRLKIIDCTDLQENGSITRLKGTEPKWVGYGDPPLITPDFLQQGGVVLFDEIEKAHPQVWRWLMPVLEEGKTTAYLKNQGSVGDNVKATPQELNFNKTFIILTSNEGADRMQEARLGKRKQLGFVKADEVVEDPKDAILKALRTGSFKSIPEFLGRIDTIVAFNDLEPHHYSQIFDKMINKIVTDYHANVPDDQMNVTSTQELKDFILGAGVKKEFGARDLRQAIDNILVSPLVDLKVAKVVSAGAEIVADIENGNVVFWASEAQEKKAPPAVVVYESPEEPKEVPTSDHSQNTKVVPTYTEKREESNQVIMKGIRANLEKITTGNDVFQKLLSEIGLTAPRRSDSLSQQIGKIVRELDLAMDDKRVIYMSNIGVGHSLQNKKDENQETSKLTSEEIRMVGITSWYINQLAKAYGEEHFSERERIIYNFLAIPGNRTARHRVLAACKAKDMEAAFRAVPMVRRRP